MSVWNMKTREQEALKALAEVGTEGITARELAQRMVGNDVSGVNNWGAPLTLLRQRGRIAALKERRLRHHVYVLLENIRGRDTWDGFQHHCATCSCDGRASE